MWRSGMSLLIVPRRSWLLDRCGPCSGPPAEVPPATHLASTDSYAVGDMLPRLALCACRRGIKPAWGCCCVRPELQGPRAGHWRQVAHHVPPRSAHPLLLPRRAAAAEGESEPYLLGDSDSVGDRGFQRATKKIFSFTSPYLGQLQRVSEGCWGATLARCLGFGTACCCPCWGLRVRGALV